MSTTFKKDANQAKDSASQAVDKAKDAASHVGDAVSGAVSSAAQVVGQKAEDATSYVAGGIRQAADTVRQQGPQEGILGSATQGVASAIEGTGKYIEDKNLSGMMDDMTGLIKRNPLPAVLIGLGIGFLIGRTLSSRS